MLTAVKHFFSFVPPVMAIKEKGASISALQRSGAYLSGIWQPSYRSFAMVCAVVIPKISAGMRMRPMARSLPTESDVQAVAQYVATLPPQTPPRTLTGDLTSGAQQYQLCLACHGPDGQGNQQLGAPPLTISNDWYLLRQLQNLKQKIRGADAPRDATGAMMQPIASTLSEQAMQDVITYIQTLR